MEQKEMEKGVCRGLVILIAVQIFLLFLMPILKLATFHSHYGDLGLFDHFLYIFSQEGNFYWFLKNHFRPILFLYGELYKIFPTPYILLVSQSLIITLSGFLVYRLAFEMIGKRLDAMVFMFIYFLHPMILYNAFWDFKTEHDFIFLSLLAFYVALSERIANRWKNALLVLLMILLMSIKESVAFFILFFGIFLLTRRLYLPGIFGVIFSLLAFYLISAYVAPDFLRFKNTLFEVWPKAEKSPFPPYYKVWGDSYSDLIIHVLSHPLEVAHFIFFNKYKMIFLAVSFLPFLCLPFFAPQILLVSLPGYAIVMLSNAPHTYQVASHYGAMVIPVVFVASIVGYTKVVSLFPNLKRFLIPLLLSLTLFVSWAYAPTPNGRYFYWTTINDYGYDKYLPNREKEKDAILRYIPAEYNVSVALGYQFYLPRLGHRRMVYILPHGIEKADFVVLDMNRVAPHERRSYEKILKEVEAKRKLLTKVNGLYIFH